MIREQKECPECGAMIDHMAFRCKYTEYGNAFGDRYPSGDEDINDTNCHDSDYDEYEYECPECEASLHWDFFESDDDEEEEEKYVDRSPSVDCILKLKT